MSELMNIEKVSVGAKKLTARVRMNPGMPLRTSEDIEGTARAYYLAPAIAKHACLGDAGKEFQDCMGDTEVAHLLEHLAVEVMIETGLGGDIASGRTRAAADEDRAYEVELSCPDDALTLGALSSAAFMLDWAFLHADQPAPDFAGTVEGLKRLVLGLRTDDAEAPEGDAGKEAAPARVMLMPRARARLIARPSMPRTRTTRPPLPSTAWSRRRATPSRTCRAHPHRTRPLPPSIPKGRRSPRPSWGRTCSLAARPSTACPNRLQKPRARRPLPRRRRPTLIPP